ncbi:dTMP kinase [bacterium]|nr:dTMP kinase [bacterium]
MKKGKLIVFEGIDGCGKSTILQEVKEALRSLGFPVVSTREPGGTNCPVAEEIRKILLYSPEPLYPETEMLLFAASRAQHTQKFILPKLQEGYIVLSDRYLWSSLAYQGVGRKLGIELVRIINTPAVKEVSPDIIFLFDVPASVAWKRTKKRIKKQKYDRFEKEGIRFQETLRGAYLELAHKNPKAVVVDATLPAGEVAKIVFKKILQLLPKTAEREYYQRR